MEDEMNESSTWREVLGEVIQDQQERHRVAQALGVAPLTMLRWVKGQSTSRQGTLHTLPDLFPHRRDQLIELIAREDPAFSLAARPPLKGEMPAIPSAVYERVFQTLAICPPLLRSWTICTLIVEVMDWATPGRLALPVGYLIVTISKCFAWGFLAVGILKGYALI
jgi:hypothetical protein